MSQRTLGSITLFAFILTIFAANWAITTFGIVPVGFGLLAPAGVYFVVVDSALFLWLAFLPGQVVGKLWMTALAVALILAWRRFAPQSARAS